MITVEIDGVSQSFETVREAQKWQRQEEKRIEKERKARSAKHEKALIMAWAALGKLSACHLRVGNFFGPQHCHFFIENGLLQIKSLNGESAKIAIGSQTIMGGVVDAPGHILALKTRTVWSDKIGDFEDAWECFGAEDGQHAVISIPAELKDRLETMFVATFPEEQQSAA